MEEKKKGFRIRLNLFDVVVLLILAAVACFLLYQKLRPETAAFAETNTVTYTVRLQGWQPGGEQYLKRGDALEDAIKHYALGTLESWQVTDSRTLILNEQERRYVMAVLPGYEDVLLTITSPCTAGTDGLVLGGGYELRVGKEAFVRGPGYMGSGKVIAVEREAQK